MMRTLVPALLCAVMIFGTIDANAQFWSKKKSAKAALEAAPPKSEYEKFFEKEKDRTTVDGLIRIHKIKDKVYFELPDALLGKDMLLGSAVTEISDNTNAVIGSKPIEPIHFRFTKVDNKICITTVVRTAITRGTDDGIARSLEMSNIDPILYTFKIAVYNPDSTAYVFDATDFFVSGDKRISPFDPYSSNMGSGVKRTETFQKDKSFVGDVKAFEDNVVVKSTLSFIYTTTGGKANVKDKPFTAVMTRSIVRLPDEPYRPRITDSRIAIFPTGKVLYDDGGQRTKAVYYANRWRLEPRDMAAYLRGEKVEPVTPITFYIDGGFPESWKKYVKEGVSQWNEIFEEIGFKNAVRVLDFPVNDPQFDPDNIKYSCLRYAPVQVQNAMGPSWVDPRSGEIINASVYVYHNVIELLNNWLLIQTAPADKRVRTMNIPTEIIGNGLRYVISHEIGHCLGFMHNMSGSAVIPVDSLRSPTFTQKYGTTTSIMDYARFNYVAQPGDMERGVRLTPPRFGIYDRFLIKWSYTPLPQAATAEEEYKITSGWLRDASSDATLRFGQQQFEVIDPRSQNEDLGDNSMKASAYGIKNLKYVLANLDSWVDGEDTDYRYRQTIYDGIIQQYYTYIGHVFGNVGGINLWEKHVGDSGDHYRAVPREQQKEALRFLLDQISDLDWINNEQLMKNLPVMGSPADVLRGLVMKSVIASPQKVELAAMKATGKPYTVKECLDDVYDYVWGPTVKGRALNATQMKMQKLFLQNVAKGAGVAKDEKSKSLTGAYTLELPEFLEPAGAVCSCGAHHSAHDAFSPVAAYGEPSVNYNLPMNFESIYYGYVTKVRALLARSQSHADTETRLHYQLMLRNLDKMLK